jgi:hypothetical protein
MKNPNGSTRLMISLKVTPASACSVPAARSSAMKRSIPVISIMPPREFITLSPWIAACLPATRYHQGAQKWLQTNPLLNRGEPTRCGV